MAGQGKGVEVAVVWWSLRGDYLKVLLPWYLPILHTHVPEIKAGVCNTLTL